MSGIWSSVHCLLAGNSSICSYLYAILPLHCCWIVRAACQQAKLSRAGTLYSYAHAGIWAHTLQFVEYVQVGICIYVVGNATYNGHASEQMCWRRNVLVLRTNCNALPRVSFNNHLHLCNEKMKKKKKLFVSCLHEIKEWRHAGRIRNLLVCWHLSCIVTQAINRTLANDWPGLAWHGLLGEHQQIYI